MMKTARRIAALLTLALLSINAHAQIALRGSFTNATPASPLTITTTGVVANDYLIGAFNTDTPSGAYTVPAPLTKINEVALTVDNAMAAQASGKATGSIASLAITNASDSLVGALVAFSGVDTTTPNDATAVAIFDNAASTSARTASITTVTAGAELVAACSYDTQGTTNPTPTVSDTAGLSWTTVSAYETGGFRKVSISYALKATAGATTVSIAPTFSSGIACTLFALRPAGGGGGGTAVPVFFDHYRDIQRR